MKLITLNLRHHANRWEERFPLVVDLLLQQSADLIAFQEVSLLLGNRNQAEWIAAALNAELGRDVYQVFFTEGRGELEGREGIAILSRIPVLNPESLELPGDWRVAQRVEFEFDRGKIVFANTHLHHLPLNSESVRYPQARAVLTWLKDNGHPFILAGDLNAQPASTTIQMLKDQLVSAYQQYHHREPDFTWPTPLVAATLDTGPVEMIDYILFTPGTFHVKNCYLIGTQHHPDDPTLFPSDHFGVYAELEKPILRQD